MKFTILCVGSLGNIVPYVALGVGLKAKGHEVCIASHRQAEPMCQRAGLDFALVEGDITEKIHTAKGQEILAAKRKNLSLLMEVMKAFNDVLKEQLQTSLEAVRGSDVLIYGSAAFAGPHLSEYLNIRAFRMVLKPEHKSKELPSFIFPKMNGPITCPMGHLLSDQLFWQPIRSKINAWREKQLGIRKMSFWGPSYDSFTREIPTIAAFSPLLVRRPSDWGPHIHVTSFCRLMEGKAWLPPEKLLAFLEQGPPPLYIGFGSLNGACQKPVVGKILNVLKTKKVRTIVLDNLPDFYSHEIPDHIFPLKNAPFDWLFPKVSAVIHHGGIGTTSSGLYAGKPTLIMPFVSDQFFWGEKIAELGLGCKPLAMKTFNEEGFSSRLDELLQRKSYQEKAAEMMSNLLQEEAGVEQALKVIFKVLGAGLKSPLDQRPLS